MTDYPQRQRLANRRPHWLYRFECDGQIYTGGIGRFDDGRIAEIFINGSKVGTAAETNAQDAAIVASLALQHSCAFDKRECISLKEAADIAGKSESTMRSWCVEEGLGRRVGGGTWVVSKVALAMFLDGDVKALQANNTRSLSTCNQTQSGR